MQEVIGQLERLRRRTTLALVTQRLAVLLSWIAGLLLAIIVLDYLFRLPGVFRLGLEIVGLGFLTHALLTYLRPSLAFRPTLTQLALRVEQTLPSVSGRLASSVEFAAAGIDENNPMAARTVRDTTSRLAGESVNSAMRLDRTWRGVASIVVIAAVAITLIVVDPASARTGLSRALLPLGDARWPARTGVQSLMTEVIPQSGVHPRGQALPLRAQVTRGPDDQRVFAECRLKQDGRYGSWSQLVLTHQGDGIHERLIDTAADEVEIYFRTADDESLRERILLVPPPAIIRATLSVTPPSYASGRLPDIEQEMGPGSDDRSISESPALVGSNVRLDLELNKPLPAPKPGADQEAWVRRTFGWTSSTLPTFRTPAGRGGKWSLSWETEATTELSIHLVDQYELANTEAISYRIEAIEDRVPSVTMIDPQNDQPVLATAVVPLLGEAQDDVAIRRIGLRAEIDRANAVAGTTPQTPAWETAEDVDAPLASTSADLDLAPFRLQEGDIVRVQGVAEDIYELNGLRHDPVLSPVRRLRVISELDFMSQLRRQLGAVRQNAIRIEATQSELQDDVIDDGAQPGTERAQAQISERIADQRESVSEIDRLARTNRLDDPQLADLLQQSKDLLDFAGRAASNAVEAIEQRQREGRGSTPGSDGSTQPPTERGPPDDPSPSGDDDEVGRPDADAPAGDRDETPIPAPEIREPREEDRGIAEAQQEVRDELVDLIELLDRDEDTWVMTRQIETLLEEQTRLQARTNQLNQQTMGRNRSELSDQERTQLELIEDRQRDLAEQSNEMAESLRDHASAMEEVDPESAAGMRTAATTAEERELDRDMSQAAERVNENQLQNAMSSQQSARETLQRMLEDIEQSKRARAEQLLRRLASLIESIERLITVQENELSSLAAAVHSGDFSSRDRAMIRLNQNTQAVAAEARSAGQQARRIARSLDRAADAQGAAVAALRATPRNAGAAEEAENRSLELLKEAKELAEALQEQTEEEQVRQKREELIESYREFAEMQVAIRGDTLELAQHGELERRQLVEARRLATSQDRMGTGLSDLRRSVSELTDAQVFSLVHRHIDKWSGEVSEKLRGGDVGVDATDRQGRIAGAIGKIIEALEETMQPPDEFARDQESSGGGSSGGQQPLIPPVAELKLLHGVQEEIYDETGDLDGRADLERAQRRQRLRDLGEQQRELLELGEQLLERLQPAEADPQQPQESEQAEDTEPDPQQEPEQ